MRALAAAFAVLAAIGAEAFDSTQWLGKREMLSREAERLRAAYSNCLSNVAAPAEDVAIPLEMFPSGKAKATISAKKAMFFPETGLVWAEGVTAVRLDEDGAVVTKIEAGKCVIDRETRSGWIEGPAEVTQGRTVFRGKDVYFSSTEGYVSITRDADIVSQDLRFGGIQ